MTICNVFILLLLLFLVNGKPGDKASPFKVLYSFKVPVFTEGGPDDYTGKNVAILDVDYWKGTQNGNTTVERVFVTTPRGKSGVPATLSTLQLSANDGSPKLAPYPSWNDNKVSCDTIVSVFRVQVDSCNRLWVLDTGVVDVFTAAFNRTCPPKILIYDLTTDSLITKYEFPEEVFKKDSLFTTIIVDIRNNKCDEAFAYVTDTSAFQIVTFSLKDRDSWYFRNRLVYPYPLAGNYQINGVSFDLMDGVLGLALGPLTNDDRTVFLHSLASRRESSVLASVLRNPDLSGDKDASVQNFKVSPGERSSQSAAEVMYGDVLFFNLLGDNSIACWQATTGYTKQNIKRLAKDEEIIQFVSGMKLIDNELLMMSSTLQQYITGDVDENKINYRIVQASIDKLTKGTACRRRTNIGFFADFEQ